MENDNTSGVRMQCKHDYLSAGPITIIIIVALMIFVFHDDHRIIRTLPTTTAVQAGRTRYPSSNGGCLQVELFSCWVKISRGTSPEGTFKGGQALFAGLINHQQGSWWDDELVQSSLLRLHPSTPPMRSMI